MTIRYEEETTRNEPAGMEEPSSLDTDIERLHTALDRLGTVQDRFILKLTPVLRANYGPVPEDAALVKPETLMGVAHRTLTSLREARGERDILAATAPLQDLVREMAWAVEMLTNTLRETQDRLALG